MKADGNGRGRTEQERSGGWGMVDGGLERELSSYRHSSPKRRAVLRYRPPCHHPPVDSLPPPVRMALGVAVSLAAAGIRGYEVPEVSQGRHLAHHRNTRRRTDRRTAPVRGMRPEISLRAAAETDRHQDRRRVPRRGGRRAGRPQPRVRRLRRQVRRFPQLRPARLSPRLRGVPRRIDARCWRTSTARPGTAARRRAACRRTSKCSRS